MNWRKIVLNIFLLAGGIMALIGMVWMLRQLGYGWFGVETCWWADRKEVCALWNPKDLIDAGALWLVGGITLLKAWFGPKWFPKWFE